MFPPEHSFSDRAAAVAPMAAEFAPVSLERLTSKLELPGSKFARIARRQAHGRRTYARTELRDFARNELR